MDDATLLLALLVSLIVAAGLIATLRSASNRRKRGKTNSLHLNS